MPVAQLLPNYFEEHYAFKVTFFDKYGKRSSEVAKSVKSLNQIIRRRKLDACTDFRRYVKVDGYYVLFTCIGNAIVTYYSLVDLMFELAAPEPSIQAK